MTRVVAAIVVAVATLLVAAGVAGADPLRSVASPKVADEASQLDLGESPGNDQRADPWVRNNPDASYSDRLVA